MSRYYAEYSEMLILDNVADMLQFLSSHPSIRVLWMGGKAERYFFGPSAPHLLHLDGNPSLKQITMEEENSTSIEWVAPSKKRFEMDLDALVSPPPSQSLSAPSSQQIRHHHEPATSSSYTNRKPKVDDNSDALAQEATSPQSNTEGKKIRKKRYSEGNIRNLPVVNIYDIDLSKLQQIEKRGPH